MVGTAPKDDALQMVNKSAEVGIEKERKKKSLNIANSFTGLFKPIRSISIDDTVRRQNIHVLKPIEAADKNHCYTVFNPNSLLVATLFTTLIRCDVH